MKCEIINEKVKYSKKLGFKVSNKEKDLPPMYCIPKIYKNPCGTRLIIASELCSSKQLSKSISSLFKLVCNKIEDFHRKVKFLSNYNKFWVLQNCVPIINTLNKEDFSRLYIKLLHNKLQGKAFWCKKVKSCIEFTSNLTRLKLQPNT